MPSTVVSSKMALTVMSWLVPSGNVTGTVSPTVTPRSSAGSVWSAAVPSVPEPNSPSWTSRSMSWSSTGKPAARKLLVSPSTWMLPPRKGLTADSSSFAAMRSPISAVKGTPVLLYTK